MNCKYCQAILEIHHFDSLSQTVYYCDYCFANIIYSENNKLMKEIWYTFLPSGRFTITIEYDPIRFTVLSSKDAMQPEIIIQGPSIPNWTPLNSKRKLKAYLPFL